MESWETFLPNADPNPCDEEVVKEAGTRIIPQFLTSFSNPVVMQNISVHAPAGPAFFCHAAFAFGKFAGRIQPESVGLQFKAALLRGGLHCCVCMRV